MIVPRQAVPALATAATVLVALVGFSGSGSGAPSAVPTLVPSAVPTLVPTSSTLVPTSSTLVPTLVPTSSTLFTAPTVSNIPAATTTTVVAASTTTSTTQARSTSLIPIPAGCDTPPPAQVIFVGEIVDIGTSNGTARYELRQVRAGETGGRERSNLLDVRYGEDIRFLDIGSQYLVGAAVDGESEGLVSKVREDAQLFGGNEVLDVGETDVDCPVLEDPVRTLTVTGRDIETGLLSPLSGSSDRIARAILVPAGVAVVAVVALAVVRWILTGLFRGAGAVVGASRVSARRKRWR